VLLGQDKSASKTLRGVGGETDKTSKKMQTFHKVGSAAGVALAGGLLLAGKAAVDMTKKAAEDESAASKLANTIHKTTGATKTQTDAVEDWITAQGKATGVTDDELRPALSKLVSATHNVSKAQHLALLAQDVAVGRGKSLTSVSEALAKAQNGNVSGLARLGVATKDADGKTKSLHAITRDLANTYGGAAAKNAQTAAGKQKILTTQMGELQEQIGAKLLPVMLKLTDAGLKVVDWISHNTTTVGVLIGVLGGLAAVTWGVSAAISAWTAITKLATGIQIVWTNVQWALNAALAANPIGLVVIAIAALVVGLIVAYKKSETFRDIVNGAFHAIQKVVGAVVGFIKSHWKLLFVILTGPVGLAVLFIIKHWGKVKSGASAVVGFIKNVFKAVFNILAAPFRLAASVISNVWGKVRSGVSSAVSFVKSKFGDVVEFVKGIPGKIGDLAGKFLSAGKNIGGKVIDGLFDGLKAVGGAVGDLASSIKGAINSALHLPFTIKGPGPLPDFTIPAFAKGGIVNGPTLALLGDNPGGREAVVPLSGPNARGLGNTTVHITVNVPLGADKGAAGKEIVTALKAYERVAGVRVLG